MSKNNGLDRNIQDSAITARRMMLDEILKKNPINPIEVRDFLIAAALRCDRGTLEHIENVRKDLSRLDEAFQRDFEHFSIMIIKTYTHGLGSVDGKALRTDLMNTYIPEYRAKLQAAFESPGLLTRANLSRDYQFQVINYKES